MRRAKGALTTLALACVSLGLADCASKPPSAPAPSGTPAPPPPAPASQQPAVPVPPPLSPQQMIKNALIELNNGEVGTARVGLVEMLARTPGDPVATDLLKQIDTDAKTLLGDKFFVYTIRPRETLAMVAKRFLGSSYRFWALAKYNDIAVPAKAAAGTTIRVPGDPPVVRQRPGKPVAAAPERPTPAAERPPRPSSRAWPTSPRRAACAAPGSTRWRAVRSIRRSRC